MRGIQSKAGQEASELYSMGMEENEISLKLGMPIEKVAYYIGQGANAPQKPYIEDKNKREKEINKLREKGVDKTYKERIYMSYLQGRISIDLYGSAFNF